ncbi:uncharacterized protein M6B38_226030 [Iris pallida]|uniref:NAD-dependent epimerase/dehydratase domain-containing protein n=1 Tax=Iris pallida TaxID=29817 RepID=A0AAX6DVK0_IRIPA|nr:uncharacterized protein M6B38_226030 [Iris pallida]
MEAIRTSSLSLRFRAARPAAAATSESQANRMFVFGYGFVGRYVSERLKTEGWQVSGTCTSAVKKRQLEDVGLEAFMFDVNKDELKGLYSLQDATHLLISIPPIPGIGDPLVCLHEDLRSTLSCGNLQWLCYLSSTSVYGDCGGAWVDEDYPVNPKRESAKARFSAEKGWLDLGHDLGVAAYVFRLGGIYGPGRSALDTIISPTAMSEKQKMRNSRRYTARVHVADIYQAIKASFDVPYSGRIYNVVDDEPAPRAEVFAYAQDLIQRKGTGLSGEIDDGDLASFGTNQVEGYTGGGEKRVSNARLKKELGVELFYPTYRSGLQSISDSWTCRDSHQPR